MPKIEFQGGGSLRAAEYDDASGVLTVEFAGGETRRYAGVSAEQFAEFAAAPKPAKWFSDKIRSRPKAHPEVSAEVSAEAPAAPSEAPPFTHAIEPADAPPAEHDGGRDGIDEHGVPMSVRRLVALANRNFDQSE